MSRRLPGHLALLLKLLVLGLIVGQLFRLVLLASHGAQWQSASSDQVLRAFFDRGLLYDLCVNAWVLLIPLLLLGVRHALGSSSKALLFAARWTWTVLFLVVLLLSCADLPFYAYTNMRLTDMALSTAQTLSQSVKELVSTPPYLIALMAFVLLAVVVVRVAGRLFRGSERTDTSMRPARRWAAFALSFVVLIHGLRGTVDPADHSLAPRDAYFCETPFLNQLGTNATYSFIASLTVEHVDLMPAEVAIANARRYLGITDQRHTSPLARDVNHAEPPLRKNVVLILVESLSANRLHRFGHPKNLMPFLESVMESSFVLDRFYSAGTRTCNGVFSSLYGLPAIGRQHPMVHPGMTAQAFHGLPNILREAGYRTSFLYPGDPDFDNMGGFLPQNGFDIFVSQDDFADSIPRNSWGVTDHALYGKALQHITALRAKDDAPFFATLMTISSHKGYNVPDDIVGFRATSAESDENIYEYADRALEEFFRTARKETWFANTVFVIVGDHGQRFDPLYEVPTAYHHVPLVIHAPGLVEARTEQGFGTQVDLPETILGLLRIAHVNNTLGMDLLERQHPAAYFYSDARLCAIDERSYWIRTGEVEHLYDHPSRSTVNIATEREDELERLRTYAMSMAQAAQWLVDEKLVGKPQPR